MNLNENGDLTKNCKEDGNDNVVNTALNNIVADHIQFLITEIGPITPKTPSSINSIKEFDKDPPDDYELVADENLVSPLIFCQVFPFHLMFNRQMKIVQAGHSVSRVIPKLLDDNCSLSDILEAVRPHIYLSFQNILSHISTIYVLKTKSGTMLEPNMFMRLKVSKLKNLHY